MLLIEFVGHIGLRSLTDGHLRRHLEYFKTLNDARVASVGFIKYNASTARINKEKNFKIKFQVILVFYWTIYRVMFYYIAWSSMVWSDTFSLSTKSILLINVKMPTIVGILTFISMIHTTSERFKAIHIFTCRYFSFMSS